MPASTSLAIPLVNGANVVPLSPGSRGQIEVTLRAAAAPSAGTLKIEGQRWTDGKFETIGGASAIALSTALAGGASIRVTDYGHYFALRFTIASLTGGTGPLSGLAYSLDAGVADEVFNGLRAVNTQSYTESNVKLGQQFYVQTQIPVLEHGTFYDAVLITGALPVLVKDRQVYVSGNLVSYQAFKGPTYSGGTPITIQNFNDISPGTSTVQLLAGVTTTATGTSWGDAQRVYGANSASNRVGAGLVPGGDKILAPNKAYLVRFSNLDTTTGTAGEANIDYFLSWYEGSPDLPRA